MPDMFTPPTAAEAKAAMDALGYDLLETVAAPAVDYLNGRRQCHGEELLSGREVGQVLGAVALAVRAYQEQQTTPADAAEAAALLRSAADHLDPAVPGGAQGDDTTT